MDQSYPLNRLNSILDQINANMILVSPSVAYLFKSREITIVEVYETCFFITQDSNANLPKVLPQNAAVVLFSSGSTGKPKAMIKEHSATSTCCRAWAEVSGIENSSRVLQSSSLSFTLGVMDLFATLIAGGCLCLGTEEDGMNNLAGVIRFMRITNASLTPSVASVIEQEDFPTLKTLSLGGEPMTKSAIQTWSAKLKLISIYGSAEAFGCIAGDVDQERPSTIGRAMASAIWIVDPLDYNRLMPIGEEGEILSESHLLARAYLNEPEKTSQAFIEDPEWLQRGSACCEGRKGRLFRMGDLGQYNSDGTIRYIGRKDTQIKLRGQRVELEEVEYYLRKYFLGPVAAELIIPRERNQAMLACFIALNNDQEGTLQFDRDTAVLIQGLSTHLSQDLPSYMVPSAFVALGRLPKTVTGKLDRMRLRKIGSEMLISQLTDIDSPSAEGEKLKTSPGMEETMRDLWAKVLELQAKEIAIQDNFFKLGGDSITVMRLVTAARAMQLDLTAQMVFRHPTLSTLSSKASMLATSAAAPELNLESLDSIANDYDVIASQLGVQSHDIEDVVPATDWQEISTSHGAMETRAQNYYIVFEFKGSLDIARLKTACRHLVARQSILRTVFWYNQSRLLQVVLTAEAHDMEFKQFGHTAVLPFDVQTMDMNREAQLGDKNVRFMFLEGDINHQTLIMRISHAQFDMNSVPMICRSLQVAYKDGKIADESKFSHFIIAIQDTTEAEQAWATLLRGASMTKVVSQVRPSYEHIMTSAVCREIANPSSLLEEYNLTFATVLKAAWAVVLARLSHNTDVVFGEVVSGRNIPLDGIDNIVGPCLNIIPVRVQFEEISTALDLLRYVHEQHIQMIPYENLGLQKLIRQCTSWPPSTRFSSGVNFLNRRSGRSAAEELDFGDANCHVNVKAADGDLADMYIECDGTADGLSVVLEYCHRVIPDSAAHEILEQLCETINILSTTPLAIISPSTSCSLSIPFPVPRTQETQDSLQDPIVSSPHSMCLLRLHKPKKPTARPNTAITQKPRELVLAVWQTLARSATPHADIESGKFPYYELWDALKAAAHLSVLYHIAGVDVGIENIMSNPTMEQQICLIESIVEAREA